jgi:WD40 repeat protein
MLLYEDHRTADQASVVYALAFSPDGSALASGSRDGALLLRHDDGTHEQLLTGGPKRGSVHAVAYHPTDPVLFVAGSLGWFALRKADGGEWLPGGLSSAAPATALAVLDGNTVAVGTGDRVNATAGNLELWSARDGRRAEPYFMEPNGVRAVAVCRKKKLVAWATGHRTVSVWDVTKQDPAHFHQTKTSPALALSPDGTTLATAVDYTARLYDLAKRRERAVLKGHKGVVSAVAFSPDGATLATGGGDHTVRLWDAASGRERAVFQWPVGRVFSLAYAPDGLRLAAGGDLGAVVVWDTE